MNLTEGGLAIDHRTDPRVLLANERTFLSWIRTGISLMAFGFVISKFDLFLHYRTHHPLHEQVLGLILVGTGIVVIAGGTIHFERNQRQLIKGETVAHTKLIISLGTVVATLGVVVFFYLVTIG